MYPSKEDIQFFYDLGVYTKADVMSYVAQGSITEEEADKIINKES
ncbi:XkdX family protein [Enterococcus hirae]|uniref:XkdX family protein n=1 Tax=Enterococcus gallinarum TaxID=1353 RepID=A0ABD4HSD0_ENTGA|nr:MULTISPECIES: XkdX family protein [Enterococcus]MBA0963031.1 XkdX family protein [Enterococcus gallinarum]MBA0974395.1 XkdX family protein [Enterococcus gallinarum]MBA5253824.1 XkdX family protein [Enterococcus hirae]MCR1911479.1 XkdX family protein [Enterococcus hirae]MDL4945510.1 XkdX family protein [Enterococcus hirae]